MGDKSEHFFIGVVMLFDLVILVRFFQWVLQQFSNLHEQKAVMLRVGIASPEAAGERSDDATAGDYRNSCTSVDPLPAKKAHQLGASGFKRLIAAIRYDRGPGIDDLLVKTSGDVLCMSNGSLQRIVIGFHKPDDKAPAVFFEQSYIQPVARDNFTDIGKNQVNYLL